MKSTNRIKPLNLAIKLIMAGTLVLSNAHAAEDKKQASSNDKQISALDTITVSTKRENRVSTGATGLPLKIICLSAWHTQISFIIDKQLI